MHRFVKYSWLILLGLVASADDKDTKPAVMPIKVVKLDRKEPVAYEKDIEPILIARCSGCHAGKIKEAELDMSTYERLMKGGDSGTVIVAGKSADSLLVKLAGRTAKPTMPPKKEEPLTPEELALVKLWIDQGAKPPSAKRERPKVIVSAPPAGVHPVRALTVSSDKMGVVAVGRGNQLHLFDANSGEYQRSLHDPDLTTSDKKPIKAAHLALIDALAFSPDNKLLASGSFQEVILWDVADSKITHRLTGFADRVVALAFSPDGKYLATGGGAPAEDGEIRIYEVDTGKRITEIKNGHSDTVFGLAFSPEGSPVGNPPLAWAAGWRPDANNKKLATCGADKFVKVFEIPSGKFIKSFEGHTNHVLDVAWKGDGKLLASAGADNVVKIWDYEKGEQVRTINAHAKQVTRLVFVGNTSQFITCSGDQTVKLWNVDTGAAVRTLPGSKEFLGALGTNSDGSIVAAGGEDGVVSLFNGLKGQLTKTLSPPRGP